MAVLSFVVDDFALATLPAGADEAGGPPPTKFYELRDNLSIQFVRLIEPADREPGHSFDDVWERIDEFQEGLGFLEDLRTLDERFTALDAEVSRQGRAVNLVVMAVLVVVATTLLGAIIAGLLTLGASVDLVESANRVIPHRAQDRVLGVVALFALAAIVAAAASAFRVRRESTLPDSSGIGYARAEALRDLRAERLRAGALAAAIVALLGVGAAAVVTELDVAWWLATLAALGLLALALWRFWGRVWWALPRWRVDERVRRWEREASERGAAPRE